MAMAGMASLRVNALSWDTQTRLPYNPHFKRKTAAPKTAPPQTTLTSITAPHKTPPPSTPSNRPFPDVTELLKHNNSKTATNRAYSGEYYMGYERWLPRPPKVEKPRSVYNAVSLAYIGDCIYELYARRHFLFPPLSIEEFNDRVMAVVRCEAQDALLHKLLDENYLSEKEREVLRWGKNIGSASKTRSKKRAGVAVYNRASSLEALVGYLYLTDMNRLEEVMLKLGFLAGASAEMILEESNSKQPVS